MQPIGMRTGGAGSGGIVTTSDSGGTDPGGNPACAVTQVARRLAEDQGAPFAVVVDAANVYWTGNHIDPGDYVVNKVSRNGGTFETLVSHYEGGGLGIAVDAANVYFTTDASVMKVPIGGGRPSPRRRS